MAEFFAAWGSTPGSTINAGLTALKAKLPDIINDSREEAKIRRAINKDIAALDKADRLEKSGAWDEAAKIKQDQSKNAYNVWGKKVDYLSARESDASRIKAAQIGAESRVEAAGSRASGGGFKTVQDAENALDKHIAEGNKIGSQYSTDKAIVKARKADYEAGKLDADKKKRYEDSLREVQKFETREKELRDNVNFFKQNKGMTTTSSGSSSGSSGVDLNSFWSQK
jgi:soluble cytochrome b562